jgi:hypothetical protein
VRVSDGEAGPNAGPDFSGLAFCESLHLGGEIGSIVPGMQADIVGFDGDPPIPASIEAGAARPAY